jgi:hypothetical protein
VLTLGTRTPEVVTQPDYLAALLRQSPQPVRLELPTPQQVPFEELADLLTDPITRELLAGPLAHLLSGPADLTDYHPGAWELYYHRRQETPLRKRVGRAAWTASSEETGDNTSEKTLAKYLSLLADWGDVPTLTELAARFDRRARGRQVRTALDRAPLVARQVELDSQAAKVPLRTFGSTSRATAPETPSRPQPRDVPELLDRGLLGRVLSTIEIHLGKAAPVDGEYIWALYALNNASLSRAENEQIFHHLLQTPRGALDAVELWYVGCFLQTKTTWELPEVTLEQVVTLWSYPQLRAHLAEALAKRSSWPQSYRQMLRFAQRTGHSVDGMLTQWLPLQLERDVDTALSAVDTPAELELLLEVAFTHMQPPQWLAIYQALYGYAEAAYFLDRLSRTRLVTEQLEQFKSLVAGANWHYPDDQARGSWLVARLAEKHSM